MNAASKPAVVVTGISGNLGVRLEQQLPDFSVIGLDVQTPQSGSIDFRPMDLGAEESCHRMVEILRESGAASVVHLAFVVDPQRTGIFDSDRMWQINVAGTARVMEAIAHVNRTGGSVRKFIFPSSVSVYGPETPGAVGEDSRLNAHTLPYALHKQEADEVVRARARALGVCSTYILRPHIYTGATVQNYFMGALRGTPGGRSFRAERMRAKGTRLPLLLPRGAAYEQKLFQFVHVDDVARLIAHILRRPENGQQTTVLNVAGRGEALTLSECAALAGARMVRLPGRGLCRLALSALWKLGISGVPPEALPYMIGSYTMDTSRLRNFLGNEYEQVIRYSIRDALVDSFAAARPAADEIAAAVVSSQ